MARSMAVAAAALVVLTLAGCAGQSASPGAGSSGITLAQSKSPVQLLRNEAASRLPSIIAKDVAETGDTSIACLSAEEDPEGISRAWHSSLTLLVTNSRAASIHVVTEDLVASFVEQGWVAAAGEADAAASVALTVLTNGTSPVTIELQELPKAEGQKAAIRITTVGPCVDTDGTGSDEVTALESSS